MSDRIYIDIDDIVNEYMLQLDDDDYGSTVSRSRVRNLAYGAIRDLQFDTLKNITAMVLPIDANTQKVVLPEDFVDWVRVGIIGQDGSFLPLSQNNQLSFTNQEIILDNLGDRLLDNDGAPLTAYHQTSVTPTSVLNYSLNAFQVGEFNKGGIFGLGGGVSGNGQFKFDKANGALFVDTAIPSQEVLLEYVADESMRKNPRVLTYAIEAVKAFIYKNLIAKKIGVPANEKMLANRAYANEKKKVRARVNKLSKADIMFQISARTQSAPRTAGRIY